MTKCKNNRIDMDYRRFKLILVEIWSPEIYTILTQLDMLRIRNILKEHNLYLFNKFDKILSTMNKYTEDKIDFDRELPRTEITEEELEYFHKHKYD